MNQYETIDLIRRAVVLLLGFAASVAAATLTIRYGLKRLRRPEAVQDKERSSLGFWIGFFETILVFVFVFHQEFSALAIIFAAKEFVRKEKIVADPGYYLLGTLVNLSSAVLFALLSKWIAGGLFAGM